MQLIDKLAILADAAKYDASCASSGTEQRNSKNGKGIGSSGGMGICHSYTPDGRCVSLLKILLTNFCIYECSYCVNRASSQVKRARFTVDEVVKLTIDFYKRNYIEGLFLSSGIIKNEDYTMEQISLIAKKLRTEHDFRGYIHLKTIPDASPELLTEAGKYADRLSINVEMPTDQSLQQFAPEKSPLGIKKSMARLKSGIAEAKAHNRQKKTISNQRIKSHIKFAPAGQSTQMIVGADQSNDRIILTQSNQLYNNFKMRRVYYSAFSPIPDSSQALPLIAPPLMREHRLYQADWLLRFYGFEVDEITPLNQDSGGMLDLKIDPKLSWAINNRDFFPINLNKASMEHILRVPGIGAQTARRIVGMRRFAAIRMIDLQKLRVAINKIKPFVETSDYHPKSQLLDMDNLRAYFIPPEQQQLAF